MIAPLLRPSAAVAALLALSTAAAVTPVRAADKQYTVGYSVATLANPFFQGMTKGVVDAVKANPQLTLINTSAQGDANTQASQIQDLINRKVDALVINPINAQAIVPTVKAANKAGIPVFTLDRGAACGPCQVNFLETNNIELGKEGADYIAAQLKKRYGSVKGNVVDLEGLIGTTAGDDREAGFTKEIEALAKANPELKVVARQEGGFDAEKSFNAMTGVMTANPQIDAVFNGNDDNAVGALRAIRQANRAVPIGDPKHIVVVGIDGTEQALTAIREGSLDATLSQNPLTMAAQSVKYVAQYLGGKKTGIPQHAYWPHLLLTKANVDSAQAKTYGLWGDDVSKAK
jgi:ribose transport system substrate-binding protein